MQQAEAVVRLMMAKDYVPLPLARVAELMEITPEGQEAFRDLIDQLRMAGLVVVMKKERLCLAKGVGELAFGRIHFHFGHAPALFFPDGMDKVAATDALKIADSETGTALHGDRVLARVLPMRGFRARRLPTAPARYASVMYVIERKHTRFSGTLRRSGRFWSVAADDPRVHVEFLVPDPSDTKLDPKPAAGDCVQVEMQSWDDPHMNPEAALLTTYGKARTPNAEYKALLDQYELDPEFPPAVEAELGSIPDEVLPEDRAGRMDMRDVRVFTIDPDTAKDFDDALSVEPLPEGGWRVGVHIADVSHYVKPGTMLDSEARRRGNSTYLVGTVIPMLPHKLSSGLCSLVEGKDRLTKSVFLHYGADGIFKPEETTFANTVICSAKRLSYHQAIAFLREKEVAKIRAMPVPASHETGHAGRALTELSDAELEALHKDIRTLWKLAERLRAERMFKGSLDLDMPDTVVHIDKDGYACSIEKLEYDESHQLIEEFMLSANEAVARNLRRAQLPLIHRVHDKPDDEKLAELAEYLRVMGLDVKDLSGRKELCRALDLIRAHPQSHILRTEFLRSLKQACYRADADGHFGLNKSDYTHFTSPIRRYSDLSVHRVFDFRLNKLGAPTAPANVTHYTKAALDELAAHLSITEQNSTQAERESVKMKKLQYFERECLGKPELSFEAVITDVRKRGLFVELSESMTFGMIPASELKDDLYHFDQDNLCYIGRRSGRRFRIGDTLRVSIAKVDRARRLIDFSPAGAAVRPQKKRKGKK
ncbi:MAG: RNB domain-containing ribonuclease [Opitutales bacterium]|nr:RNB domain-containing ribonuclease [Opitutales bacterium]